MCRFRLQVAYLGVDLLIKCGLLQLQLSFGIGHLGVSLELDVHHLLPTFCFLVEDGQVFRRLRDSHMWEFTNALSLHTRMPASLSASATPMSASLWTAAVCVFPRELR